jgi:hypothetical protein
MLPTKVQGFAPRQNPHSANPYNFLAVISEAVGRWGRRNWGVEYLCVFPSIVHDWFLLEPREKVANRYLGCDVAAFFVQCAERLCTKIKEGGDFCLAKFSKLARLAQQIEQVRRFSRQ